MEGNVTYAIGALDPNAICTFPSEADGLGEENYYEGCHIKTKDVEGKKLSQLRWQYTKCENCVY